MDRQEIRHLLNILGNNSKHLTPLQHKFIASLKEHYKSTGFLTKKEVECLYDLNEYLPSVISEETESVYAAETDKYLAQYSSFDYGTSYNGPF